MSNKASGPAGRSKVGLLFCDRPLGAHATRGNPFCVAFGAAYGMHIVHAVRFRKAGIHFLDVEPAIRQARVAIAAGPPNLHRVRRMARKATQSLVNSPRRAVVPRSGFMHRSRRVALVAEPLPRIGGNRDQSLPGEDFRLRQEPDIEIGPLTPVIETRLLNLERLAVEN